MGSILCAQDHTLLSAVGFGVDKRSTIIGDDSLVNAEPIYNTITDEVGYSSPSCSPEGYCLDPFGVAFYCCYDPYVAPGRWVDGTGEVKGPV